MAVLHCWIKDILTDIYFNVSMFCLWRCRLYIVENWEMTLSVYWVFVRKSLFVRIDQEPHSFSIVFSLTSAVQIWRGRFAYSKGDYFQPNECKVFFSAEEWVAIKEENGPTCIIWLIGYVRVLTARKNSQYLMKYAQTRFVCLRSNLLQ